MCVDHYQNFPINKPLSPMPIFPVVRHNPKTYSGKDVRPFLVLRILMDNTGKMLSRNQMRKIAQEHHNESNLTNHVIERAVVTAREAGFDIDIYMASPLGGSNYFKYYKLTPKFNLHE